MSLCTASKTKYRLGMRGVSLPTGVRISAAKKIAKSPMIAWRDAYRRGRLTWRRRPSPVSEWLRRSPDTRMEGKGSRDVGKAEMVV